MACEDWLYEEETYDIIDAAVFEDRLAQIESMVDAHLRTEEDDTDAAGGGNGSDDDDQMDD